MGGEALAHKMLGNKGQMLCSGMPAICLASSPVPALPLPDRPLGGIFSHALIISCLDHILSCGNQAGTEAWGFLTLLWPYFLLLLFLFYFLGSETSSSKLSSASFPMGLEVTASPSLTDFADCSSDNPLLKFS